MLAGRSLICWCRYQLESSPSCIWTRLLLFQAGSSNSSCWNLLPIRWQETFCLAELWILILHLDLAMLNAWRIVSQKWSALTKLESHMYLRAINRESYCNIQQRTQHFSPSGCCREFSNLKLRTDHWSELIHPLVARPDKQHALFVFWSVVVWYITCIGIISIFVFPG